MLDSHQIIISIDQRLAAARQEIASLEAALTAMRQPPKTNGDAGRAPRAARANGTAPARRTGTRPAKGTGTTPAQASGAALAQVDAAATPAKADRAAPAQATTRARKARKARRTRPARGAEVVPAGKLVTLLGGDGMSTSELAGQTGGDRQQLLTLLRELEAAGQVRRSGERRNTRWHAITDEDRIAARVAELERQRSRKAPAA